MESAPTISGSTKAVPTSCRRYRRSSDASLTYIDSDEPPYPVKLLSSKTMREHADSKQIGRDDSPRIHLGRTHSIASHHEAHARHLGWAKQSKPAVLCHEAAKAVQTNSHEAPMSSEKARQIIDTVLPNGGLRMNLGNGRN
ncbi:hypothetical protein EC988_006857, partial [Linderina pennispora]